jgi:hypothetical protein
MTRFKKLIESVVAVAFQSVFCVEIYQNDVFLFFKKLFLKSTHQNDPKHIKKLIFYRTRFHRVSERCLNPSL